MTTTTTRNNKKQQETTRNNNNNNNNNNSISTTVDVPSSLLQTNMITSRKTINGPAGNGRKFQKQSTSCFRTCMRLPTTFLSIYNNSRGLRSVIRWLVSVSFSFFLLLAIPLSFHSSRPTYEHLNLYRTAKIVLIGWSTLLAISPWVVIVLGGFAGFSLARQLHMMNMGGTEGKSTGTTDSSDAMIYLSSQCNRQKYRLKANDLSKRPGLRKLLYVIGLSLLVTAVISIQTNLHMMYPSWFWNPFLLRYNVYWPSSIADATAGLCVQDSIRTENDKGGYHRGTRVRKMPLCLPEKSWKSLSTDVLSSKNNDDVEAVLNGIRYLKNESGGVAFGIMARDTINAINPLRLNIEGLLPFLSNLSIVVFENDSSDGTREAFQEWSREVQGQYTVDVVECEDFPGCKFNVTHRDFEKNIPYEQTSAIGRMGEFRQRLVDHILEKPTYSNFSHYIVLDVDLSVSISPLGILHSIGKLPNEAIACSGRQPRPGSLGSLQPPYDFSAFVAHGTEQNKKMIKLNEWFCSLKPQGYRWRNECNAVSVAQFMMIESGDKLNDGEPYMVDSAFNGAILYPIDLIRKAKSKYDAGIDGQRCEHIGFNLSLKRPMYINPKWNMHLHPHLMGGPSGKRAIRTVTNIAKSPKIGPVVIGQSMVSMVIFFYCVITLTMLMTYPLYVCISRYRVGRSKQVSKNSIRERSKSPSMKEMEYLLNPDLSKLSTKRKGSEFDREHSKIQNVNED